MAEEIVIKYRAEVDELRRDLNALIDQQEQLGDGVEKNDKIFFNSAKRRTDAIIKEKNALLGLKEKRNKAFETEIPVKEFKKLNAEIKNSEGRLKKLQGAAVKTKQKVSGLSSSIKNVGVGLAAAFSVGAITSFLNQATRLTAQMDALRISFDFIEGSEAGGAETFRFLTDLAKELGLEIVSTAEAYKLFAGAARISGISAEETKRIFESVSLATTALGLSAQKAESVFRALSQIISKGTVSSEELRQQMAEVLPGSFKIAADAMNLTETEFNKLLSTGTLLATDFLPKFSEQLRTVFEEGAIEGAKSLNAELNRLSNEVTDLTLQVGEDFAPVWLKVKKFGLEALKDIFDAAQALGNLLKFSFTGDVTGFVDFTDEVAEQAEVTKRVTQTIDDVIKKSIEDQTKLAKEKGEELVTGEKKRLEERVKAIDQFALQIQASIDKINAGALQRELVGLNETAQENIKKLVAEDASIISKLLTDEDIEKIKEYERELKALNQIGETTSKAFDKLLEKSVGGKEAERQARDAIELRKLGFYELLELREQEIAIGDKASKANIANINKEFAAREKSDAALQKQIDAFTTLSDKEKEILFKLKIDYEGSAQDPEDAFVKLRDDLFKTFESETKAIDVLIPARVAEVTEGLTDEGLIAEKTQAVVDKANAEKEASYQRYLKAVQLVIKQLGLFEAETYEESVEAAKKANDKKIEDLFALLNATSAVFNQIASLSATITDGRINDLDREQTAFEDNLDKQREALEESRENRLITESEFQSSLADIDNQESANAKKIAEEKRKLARKQALLEKSAAIFSIGINTSRAIIAALASVPPNVPLSVLIGALGALQVATVAATPVPKFAKGTKDKKGSGMALVGEQGAEQVYLPDGAKVLPAKQTKTYGQVFDAMYDNNFDEYINKNYITPALLDQKKRHEEEKQESFANNIVSSMQFNGMTYYDGLKINSKGQNVNNVKELAGAIAEAVEINTRRL